MNKVGIIGYGTMGAILGLGFSKHAEVHHVYATRKRGEILPPAQRIESNSDLARRCEIIVLCVKPAEIPAVALEIAPYCAGRLVISIATGVQIADLRAVLGGKCALVRAMPNTPCRIGQGMTLIASDAADAEHARIAKSLFDALGSTLEVAEPLLAAGTALSGCGPAYLYEIVEALCDGAVKLGLARSVARTLAAHTMAGAAHMILQSQTHPFALQDEVVTPGGCTIAGLLAMRDAGVGPGLTRAVIAAGKNHT